MESHAADGPYAGVPRVKLTLIYYHDIFCLDECRKHTIDGCSKITGQLNKLTCREEVQLIRPKKLAELWIKKQYQQGYIDLTLKEAGIEHAKAHIISIIPSAPGKLGKDSNAQWVTGIFKRHALNTGDYTFKNTDTGQLSIIHATPNHLFYLKNRRTFLPVRDITEKDTLITVNGNSIKLVNFRANTGVIGDRKTNIPVWTYNFEVWKKHTYFAGSDKILVHNTCKCGICEEELDNPEGVRRHFNRTRKRNDTKHMQQNLSYVCGIDGCTVKTNFIDEINLHQRRVHDAHNKRSCYFCGQQYASIANLEKHLENNYSCRFQGDGFRVERLISHEEEPIRIGTVIKEESREVQPGSALSSSNLAPFVFGSSGDQQLDKSFAQFAAELPDELLDWVPPDSP